MVKDIFEFIIYLMPFLHFPFWEVGASMLMQETKRNNKPGLTGLHVCLEWEVLVFYK